MNDRIGFIQGRFSPLINERIQSFPWPYWQEEFSLAEKHGFHLMEWTLDQERLYENPLMTVTGQAEIRSLCKKNRVIIPSLTGDCFMQEPFWKYKDEQRRVLENDFVSIAEACASIGISMIVVPLVDNGKLENCDQEDVLVSFLSGQLDFLTKNKLKVLFESDFGPAELARFIGRLDPELFGINYDIGNSAALGFNPAEEIDAYGNRILNVHVKDRVLGGTTVTLGTGNASFETVFSKLANIEYKGNYILQTARAVDDNHEKVLCHYRDMTNNWNECYGA